MRGIIKRHNSEVRQCLTITGLVGLLQIVLLTWLLLSSMDANANSEMNEQSDNLVHELSEIGQGSLLFKKAQAFERAPMLDTQVHMEITGMINRVRLVQEFSNQTDQWQEGIYVFPLPENAAVDRLRLHIGDRIVEGQIKEKQQAKKTYEQARQNGQRAALVEQERPNIFTTSVANIPPKGTILVEIEYQQLVKYDSGLFSLRFPMVVGPRYIPGKQQVVGFSGTGWAVNTDEVPDAARITPPVMHPGTQRKNQLSITINLDAGLPLEHINSPYHAITINKQHQRYQITLRQESTLANRDFELTWQPHPSVSPKAAFFTEQKDNETYAMVMLLPPETEQAKTINREMIYVIDTSGSMGGQSIRQAKAALELALTRLRPGDSFNIIQFNSFTSKLYRQSQPVNQTTLTQALNYIRSLNANGGTEMATAMHSALAGQADNRVLRQVIFMTDGSIGNEQALFDIIRDELGQSRLFTVGIGSAPNSYFMQRAASFGRGTYTYIGKLNEVQGKMDALFAKIESPVLKDITIDWGKSNYIEMWPQTIGDLYRGEPLMITARAKQLPNAVIVSGRIAEQTWSADVTLTGGQDRTGLSVLWARKKIATLMQSKRNDEFESIKQTVIDTALKHHLVSQYTSLVAVDVTPVRPANESLDSQAVPTHLPEGWEYNKVFGQPYPATATSAREQFLIGSMLLLLSLFLFMTQRRSVYS